MKALKILILTSIFCCFVTLEAFSNQLKASGTVPDKLDSVISYTYASKTDSTLSTKAIYSYSADSLEVRHITYKYVKESQTWTNSTVDSSFYDNQKRKTKYIAYTWESNTNKWVPTNKTEYSYLENLVTTIYSGYDAAQMKWVPRDKRLARSDVKSGKLLMDEYYIWDAINNQFRGYERIIKVYNESYDLIRDTVFSWSNSINDWKDRKTVHNYNKSGKDTLYVVHTWNAGSSAWVPTSKYINKTYTKGINLFRESLTLNWDQSASQWDSVSRSVKYVYMSDIERTVTTEIYNYVTIMPAGTHEWSQSNKSEFGYDEQGRIDSIMEYQYTNNTDSWDKFTNTSFTFTESGKADSIVYYSNYNVTTQLYMWGGKDIYMYNETGQTIQEEYYSWNGGEQKWVGSTKRDSRRGNPSGLSIYLWDNANNTWWGGFSYDTYKREDGKTKMDNIYAWDSNTKSWNDSSRYFYYYSAFKAPVGPTGNTPISDTPSQISVFPNPTAGFVQFTGNDIDRVDVVSSAGTLLKSVIKPQSVDISSFPVGIYYLLVTANNGEKHCLKVIKK